MIWIIILICITTALIAMFISSIFIKNVPRETKITQTSSTNTYQDICDSTMTIMSYTMLDKSIFIEVLQSENLQFYFRIKSRNGKILCASETYKKKFGVMNTANMLASKLNCKIKDQT